MIDNFDHVHLYAADLEVTLAFYREVLGGELLGALPNSSGGQNHLVLLGGQFLAISEYPAGHSSSAPPDHGDGALRNGYGVAHIGLNVADLTPVIARLEAAGIEMHDEPRGSGPLRYVYFTAPDGVVVELTQYVLPARLRPSAAALRIFNKAVSKTRRAVARSLIRGATRQ